MCCDTNFFLFFVSEFANFTYIKHIYQVNKDIVKMLPLIWYIV